MIEQGREAVVEIAIARAKEGVTKEELMATVEAVSQWAKRQPGFISRDLTYSETDAMWIDVIWWESLEAAEAAAQAAMTSDACAPMFAVIDLENTQLLHGKRVASAHVSENEAA